jgi:hypothetical protein
MAIEIIYKINSKPLLFTGWLRQEAVKDMLIILKGFLHYIPLLSSLKGLVFSLELTPSPLGPRESGDPGGQGVRSKAGG